MWLIDVNALMEFARNQKSRSVDCNDIARFPRIDPNSLRPKGRWKAPEWNAMWQSMTAICSNCCRCGEVRVKTNQSGERVINSPYCPNCGADMREEDTK